MISFTIIPSPIDPLMLVASDTALLGLYMLGPEPKPNIGLDWVEANEQPVLQLAKDQLEEYFRGVRTKFEIPLAPHGTVFQGKVWQQLRGIPYSETISYGELARQIDQPTASRAVGMANGKNPISIIIPCHRVIGSDGKLVGYGGGNIRKEFLLNLERAQGPFCPYTGASPGEEAGLLLPRIGGSSDLGRRAIRTLDRGGTLFCLV